jgi:cytochrome c-type biogenesis protein
MIDFAAWLDQVSPTSPVAFGLVALAGLVMGVAPSSLPLISAVIGTVAARSEAQAEVARWETLSFPAGFVLGIATVDAMVGALFGFVGFLVIQVLAESLERIRIIPVHSRMQ